MCDLSTEIYSDAATLRNTGITPKECFKCGKKKKELEGCHCDANSYYKRVTPKRVLAAARFFQNKANNTNQFKFIFEKTMVTHKRK